MSLAIAGKTSRRSHDRADDKAPLHLVCAFATTSGLVLGQEAVDGKSNELSAIPILLDRLAEGSGLKGARISIDAIAKIAQAIKHKGAGYLLAVKANQPTLRQETQGAFAAAAEIDTFVDDDKGHGRIEQRTVGVIKEVDWLDGERRSPGELRLPHATTLVGVQSRAQLSDRSRFETRYCASSAEPSSKQAANAVRGHWAKENQSHWTPDVVFADDQSRLRRGHGARNMAVIRHFAINLIRNLRRKIAGWRSDYLACSLPASSR